MFITHSRPSSSQHSSNHRDAFARQAVFEEFRPRDARAIDQTDFADRTPKESARPLAEVGRERALHWLKVAANAEGDAAEVAFEAADELRQALGLSWGDLIDREAA